MPEIAEIAITAEIINSKFKKHTLVSFDFIGGRYARNPPVNYDLFNEDLPMVLKNANSKGKFLFMSFIGEKTNWYVWNTLGLSGRWSLNELPFSKAMLTFSDGSVLYFSDQRNFGTIKFSTDVVSLNKKLKELSPDLLKDDFDLEKITKYKIPVVKILLDQKKIGSGIGNYLSAEILYRAKISPHRLSSSLTKKEIKNLDYWIRYVIKLSYMDNHVGYMMGLDEEADKIKRKNYHPEIKLKDETFKFNVYRKKFDPKGNKVKADKIVGSGKQMRTTYWVPSVQK